MQNYEKLCVKQINILRYNSRASGGTCTSLSIHLHNMDSATKGKPNFSDKERSILIDEYRSNLDVTRRKLGSMLAFYDKEEAWKKITDKLNAPGDGCRTVPEVFFKNGIIWLLPWRRISPRRRTWKELVRRQYLYLKIFSDYIKMHNGGFTSNYGVGVLMSMDTGERGRPACSF